MKGEIRSFSALRPREFLDPSPRSLGDPSLRLHLFRAVDTFIDNGMEEYIYKFESFEICTVEINLLRIRDILRGF